MGGLIWGATDIYRALKLFETMTTIALGLVVVGALGPLGALGFLPAT